MSQIEFKVTLDTTNAAHMAAAVTFMQALSPGAQESPAAETEQTAAEQTESKKPVRKTTPKKETAPEATSKKETAPETKTQEPEEEPQNSGEAENTPDITDIRKLLATKVEDHRDKIKSKLTELGAKSVSTLEKENYAEFHNFLQTL